MCFTVRFFGPTISSSVRSIMEDVLNPLLSGPTTMAHSFSLPSTDGSEITGRATP